MTRFKGGSQEVDILDCVHKLVLHLSVERTNLSWTTGQLTRNLVRNKCESNIGLPVSDFEAK